MKKFNIFILCTLCFAGTAPASDFIEANLRIYRTGEAPSQVRIPTRPKALTIDLPEGIRSAIIRYKGPPEFQISGSANGGPTYHVGLAGGKTTQLVILDATEPGSVMVVDDDAETHALGALRIINASSADIDIALADEKAAALQGKETFLPLPEKPTAFVQIIRNSDGEILLSNNWAISRDSRPLVLITNHPDGKIRVHRITEGAPPKS